MSLLKVAATQPGFVKPKMCIISAYPDGLVPYERSELSKDCLRPSNLHLRDWLVRKTPRGVPFLSEAVRYEGHSLAARISKLLCCVLCCVLFVLFLCTFLCFVLL